VQSPIEVLVFQNHYPAASTGTMFALKRREQNGELTMTFKRTRVRNNNSSVVIWALISLVLVLAVAILLLVKTYIVEEEAPLPSKTLSLDKTSED
jgi:hypothetical protein